MSVFISSLLFPHSFTHHSLLIAHCSSLLLPSSLSLQPMTEFAHDEVVPLKNSALSKKEQVADMFDSIAFRYDFLNRFLSAGIDIRWRKKAIAQLKGIAPKQVLDVATGTADVAIMTAR